MKRLIKKIYSSVCSFFSLRGVKHGKGCRCNFPCNFSKNTEMGNNCHFNGMKISGSGRVVIGNNFHSGKNIRIITSFHNWKDGDALPYDNKYIDKEVVIGDNVWLGESVIILGGVTVGEGAIIQAGSVVCKNVPALAVAGGHPAVAFKFRDEEKYNKLKAEEKFL